MTRRLGLLGTSVVALTLVGWPAGAEPPLPDDDDLLLLDPGRDVFSWGPEETTTTAYEAAMARGDRHAIRAAELFRPRFNPSLLQRRQALAAIEAYEEAVAADPTSPEPHYRAAEMLHFHFLVGPGLIDEPLARRAIAHWKAFERLAPRDPRLDDLLFNRSVTYTKLATPEDLEAAIADYQRLNQFPGLPSSAVRLANEAEVHMMRGDLETAIERYERAIGLSSSFSHVLGLAVALDRDRQRTRAREALLPYASETAVAEFMESLRRGETFFVPAAEVYYYFGLLYEVRGERDKAIEAYQQFVRSGVHPQYRSCALENIAALQNSAKRGSPRPPRPSR